ncbi:hypothetical protein [Rubrimonas cliftonensis]|uniref:Uncharacterized protein n=1 Tax=Rubrimonas cliftonensis TaxID=89524 RepID=A0A1H3VFD9_9RHOB|nr:hypothetical protein [Rubrimonas cliftonensis]SDZ73381.1 hypothetical protein SAMN05444370_10141 [Rubrimonas cliftonensis]
MSRFDNDFWALHAFVMRLDRPGRPDPSLADPPGGAGSEPGEAKARRPARPSSPGSAQRPSADPTAARGAPPPAPQPAPPTPAPRSFGRRDFALRCLFALLMLLPATPPWADAAAEAASILVALGAVGVLSRAALLRARDGEVKDPLLALFFVPILNILLGMARRSRRPGGHALRLGRARFLSAMILSLAAAGPGLALLHVAALGDAGGSVRLDRADGAPPVLAGLAEWTVLELTASPAGWSSGFRLALCILSCAFGAALCAIVARWRDLGWRLPATLVVIGSPLIAIALFVAIGRSPSRKP